MVLGGCIFLLWALLPNNNYVGGNRMEGSVL